MHTENEQQSKQVAYNKCPHSTCELHENKEGEYYPVCQPIETPGIIRSEYIPIGRRLQYPTKWGRKRASLHLLEFKIEDAKRELENVQTELAKLERCLSDVQNWDDDSK